MKKIVFLDKINIAASPKVRSEVREETIAEYAKEYQRRKNDMPDAVLFEHQNDQYIVADGMHRIMAMKATGIKGRQFDVRKGTFQDCLAFALTANLHHGLRRTNADKRTSVETTLCEFPEASNGKISEIAAVGETLVSEVRSALEKRGSISPAAKRKGRDGRETSVPLSPSSTPRNGGSTISKPQQNDEKDHSSPVPEGSSNAGKNSPKAAAIKADDTGYPLTEKCLKIWDRRDEVQELLTGLVRIKSVIEKAFKEKDPLFCAEVNNSVIADLERAYGGIKVALPYAVCPKCNGRNIEECTVCRGRGVVSKYFYDVKIKPELKALRKK